jgi:flagellar biosynthesis/type III secretory pathway protein FliH
MRNQIKKQMTNNKQQTAVEWLEDRIKNQHLYPFASIDELSEQAKEMEIAGKEMSYADGYKEGYKRALELVEWYIKNYISGMLQDHIGDTNKKVDE